VRASERESTRACVCICVCEFVCTSCAQERVCIAQVHARTAAAIQLANKKSGQSLTVLQLENGRSI